MEKHPAAPDSPVVTDAGVGEGSEHSGSPPSLPQLPFHSPSSDAEFPMESLLLADGGGQDGWQETTPLSLNHGVPKTERVPGVPKCSFLSQVQGLGRRGRKEA